MKTFLSLAALVIATLSLPAKTFEGYVYFHMKAGRHASDMSYAIKDGRLRMETDLGRGQKSIGIFDPEAGDVKILMPQQKMYMSFAVSADTVAKATPKDVEVEETGRTKEVAGYECSEFILKGRKQTVEVWATEELGSYISFLDMQKSKGKTPGWAQVLMDRNLFPLLMITKNRRGREESRMEVQRVEPAKLDDALFEVPDGYTAFSIPGLGGLLKGLGR